MAVLLIAALMSSTPRRDAFSQPLSGITRPHPQRLDLRAARGHRRTKRCFGRRETYSGTNGPDTKFGLFADNDVMIGRGGRDFLSGQVGIDRVCGNRGDDTLFGGEGWDRVNGGPGTDDCHGEVTRKCEG